MASIRTDVAGELVVDAVAADTRGVAENTIHAARQAAALVLIAAEYRFMRERPAPSCKKLN
jgi:hypothetical protein